jgi:hypothetical protein
MSELVLFSLDTLVNMPRLYANALEKALDGRKSHEEILESLADSNLDVLGIIHEAYSEPHDDEKPEYLGKIVQSSMYGGESLRAYEKFLEVFGVGAHNCVKPKTYELLREIQHLHSGVFYPMRESILLRVVHNAKLDHRGIDIVAGFDPESEIEDVVRKALMHVHADRILLVAKDRMRAPEYEQISQIVNAEYLPCNEISDAPLEPVKRSLKL